MVATQMALKLISFIGNIRDINSHQAELPYVQTKSMSFFCISLIFVIWTLSWYSNRYEILGVKRKGKESSYVQVSTSRTKQGSELKSAVLGITVSY